MDRVKREDKDSDSTRISARIKKKNFEKKKK